jgi:hypothetical protein
VWQHGLAPILREQMIAYGRPIDTWVEISTLSETNNAQFFLNLKVTDGTRNRAKTFNQELELKSRSGLTRFETTTSQERVVRAPHFCRNSIGFLRMGRLPE